MLGATLYLLTASAIGILLGTVARTMTQFALLETVWPHLLRITGLCLAFLLVSLLAFLRSLSAAS